MFNRFIEKISGELELEHPPTPDHSGQYQLILEPNLEIYLRENPATGITLFATLAPLPEKGLEEYLMQAMSANLFGRETGHSALGCDQEGKKVTLRRTLPPEATYQQFYEALEDFANYAESWREDTKKFLVED